MIVHDKNCTWCKHRIVLKEKKGNRDTELCKFTNAVIPLPFGPGIRYCERFQQENCPCELCNS